jgi:signal transduction histidine kinase
MKWMQKGAFREGILLFAFLNIVILLLGVWREDFALSIAACGLLDAAHFFLTCKRYRNISNLSNEIDQLLHGKTEIDFHQYQEGELAILQNELRKMTVRLQEQANLLRRDRAYLKDSLADISHQLKTPMTSMHLIFSFLSKSDLSTERRRMLVQDLEGLTRKMEWLINALLLLSKLDAGVAELKQEPVSVRKLIDQAAGPILIAMEVRGISFSVSCAESVYLNGDLGWSAEAVGNILKNCMEHTGKEGKIQIQAAENELYTEMTIEDTGTGIDPEDLPHIFERFYKGKDASNQSVGIGLSLARRIIAEQNGIVEAKNKPEGGTRFLIRFYKQII